MRKDKLKEIWFDIIKSCLKEEEEEIYFCVSCGEHKEFICEYENITTCAMDKYGAVDEEGDEHHTDENYKCRSCFGSVVVFSPKTILELVYSHVQKDLTWSKKKLKVSDRNLEIKKYIAVMSI